MCVILVRDGPRESNPDLCKLTDIAVSLLTKWILAPQVRSDRTRPTPSEMANLSVSGALSVR